MNLPPILIVDDDPRQLEMFSLFLRDLPYPIRTARSSKETFAILQEQPPALIVLDVAMPEISGLEVLRAIRSNPQYNDTKVLILTAIPTAVSGADAALADGVFSKPISLTQLVQTIQGLLAAPH